MKIAYITNFCAHYRVKTYELLASRHTVDYYFFSAGDEWYWQQAHGVRSGKFHHEYLRGFKIGNTRITPELVLKLWGGGYDVFVKCINGRFALPVTFAIARLRRKPFILVTDTWATLGTPFHRLIFPLLRFVYRHSDAIIANGEHVREYLIQLGVPSTRIFTAPHAVDNESYNFAVSERVRLKLRSSLGIDAQEKVVLYLGRLEKIKGLGYLLEAFQAVRRGDAVLVLAGDGSQRAALEQIVRERGLAGCVHFAGYVPPEEAVAYYSIAWVFVLPSISQPTGKETWGLVVNEAFNQGVPVIASDAVGAAEGGLVQDGVNGFVVPERDTAALARAMRVILGDCDLRERMSINARQIIAGWNNEQMVNGFEQALDYVQGGCRR